jgi:aminoglycoside phosphotransferase (APT) family kinase protein
VAESGFFAPLDPRLDFADFLDSPTAAGVIAGAAGGRQVEITGCTIEHVRYEPGTSCVISYTVEAFAGDRSRRSSIRLYVHVFDGEGFRRALESLNRKVWRPGVLLAGATPLPDRKAILYEFPNDARLAGLVKLVEPGAAKAIMQRTVAAMRPGNELAAGVPTLSVLRYKPESRAVFRCIAGPALEAADAPAPPSAVLRVAKSARARAAHRTLERLYRWLPAHVPLSVPRPLLWDEEAGLSAIEWIDGDRLSLRWAEPDGEEVVRRTGRALAWLHASNAPEAEEQSRAASATRIENALELVATASAAVASQVQNLQAAFGQTTGRTPAGQQGCVHGDFHQGQVLLRCGSVCFLDFDGVADGEIEQDLGNFKSQLIWLGMRGRVTAPDTIIRSLFEGYREASRLFPDERRVRHWCAAGLVDLAAKQYRRLRADWPYTVPKLLATAENELLDK